MVRCWCGLAFLIGAAVAVCGEAAPYHQTDFPPEEFKARWEVIFDKIGNQAVAVVQGAARTNGFIFSPTVERILLLERNRDTGFVSAARWPHSQSHALSSCP